MEGVLADDDGNLTELDLSIIRLAEERRRRPVRKLRLRSLINHLDATTS